MRMTNLILWNQKFVCTPFLNCNHNTALRCHLPKLIIQYIQLYCRLNFFVPHKNQACVSTPTYLVFYSTLMVLKY
ncbi:unnamed protein product, partial [Dicrocoelium dendriticum]